MDSRIAIGDKLELQKIETRLSVNPDIASQTYASQVIDESENGEYLVSMPLKEGKVVPFSVGQELYATFYSKSGLYRCQMEVTNRYKQGQFFTMEITQKTVLNRIQRREYYRFRYNRPIKYRILSEEEQKLIEQDAVYDWDEASMEWKDGVMIDLSGGGIQFVSGTQEEQDSHMQVCFEISENGKTKHIYAFAILLRSEKNQNKSTIYDHCLMFWKMNERTREQIIRFIFDEERKNRSKEMGF